MGELIRGLDGTTMAMICAGAALFLVLVCLTLFAVARKKPQRVCASCGEEWLDSWTDCPYCAQEWEEPSAVAQIEPAARKKGTVKLRTPQSDSVGYLVVKDGKQVGHAFQLAGEATTIGRNANNHIVISDETVSDNHAKILILDFGQAAVAGT